MCPSPTRPSAQRMGRVLVTGASGNVGRLVVSSLAEAGEEVRAFVRDPDKAPVADAVEVLSGDLTSPQTLVPALREVDRVFLVWPGLPVDPGVVDAIADHASRVVYLSTDVSDLADDEPPTSFHQEIELLIRKSGLSWTFVRPIDFATNTLAWAGQIREGVVRLPYGRASRSLIHERDIAEVVTHVLTSPGHDGAKYVITGPESIPQAELARIIGQVIGRDVRWEDLPLDAAREQLTAAWGNAEFVEARLNAWGSFVESPERVTDTVERLLGRPARTFRSWAEEHAADFR
jgi:uncharacterized protein YbjT (DUF2867 family)